MELLARVGLARVRFVTSIVLTIALPDGEPAQPHPVIGGHLLSCAAGFAAPWTLGPGEMTSAGAVGLAGLLMLSARGDAPASRD